jgi:hypothetical protein
MPINSETRILLTLMKFRAMGIIEAQLCQDPLTAVEYTRLMELKSTDDEFSLAVGQCLRTVVENNPYFAVSIACRLFPELDAIFWAQMTDRLIQGAFCDYKNFGAFRANRSTGKVNLDFAPSRVISEQAVPEALASQNRTENLLDDISRSLMTGLKEELIDFADFGGVEAWRLPLIATSLLTRGLNQTWRSILVSKEFLPNENIDWLGILAMGTSFATYYALVLSYGVELSTRSEIKVDGVGTFRQAPHGLEFSADPAFQRLLFANPRPAIGRAA